MVRRQRLILALLAVGTFYSFFAFEAAIAADPQVAQKSDPAVPQDPAKPGEHHQHLKVLIGNWDYTMRIWNSPDAEPIEMTGTSVARWILGGRFVETYYRGKFQGRPFEGRSIDGYDNLKKKYNNIWQDNLIFEGDCSEDGKTRTMSYKFDDAASGETLTNENVTTVVDETTNRSESFIKAPSGVSFKNMELITKRRTLPQSTSGQGSNSN
jgi:hypothetical protein